MFAYYRPGREQHRAGARAGAEVNHSSCRFMITAPSGPSEASLMLQPALGQVGRKLRKRREIRTANNKYAPFGRPTVLPRANIGRAGLHWIGPAPIGPTRTGPEWAPAAATHKSGGRVTVHAGVVGGGRDNAGQRDKIQLAHRQWDHCAFMARARGPLRRRGPPVRPSNQVIAISDGSPQDLVAPAAS